MTFNIDGLKLPLTLRAAVALTDRELERFSGENRPYRVERNKQGELTVMTPVNSIGGNYEFYVAGQLNQWTEEDGTGIGFSSATGFTLPDSSMLSPDASWISLAHWDALAPAQQAGYAKICPEFVIEIRSASDSRRMVEAKMLTWIENGAQLAWLIDPIEATVAIYRPNEPTEILERPDLVLGHAPVDGFKLKTTRLWPKL